jgi:MFS family permease
MTAHISADIRDDPDHPHAAFRHRDFRFFFAARISNNLGTNVMLPALGWQIYALTRDPLALGLIGLATFIPVAAMTLPSGQVADRFERRAVYRLFQLSLTLAGIALCLLSALHCRTAMPYYIVAGLFGASKTFSAPAANAWMPRLVPRVDFPNAVAWTSSGFQVTNVAGPALAGLLIFAAGEAVTYAVVAALYLGSFWFATLVPTTSKGGDTRRMGFAHLFGGLTYIWRNPLILAATTLDLFAVLMGGATALLPIFASEILHVGASGFGLLRGAPAIGAAGMALFLAHRPLRRNIGSYSFGAVALFGVTTILFGLSKSFSLSIVILVVLGAADMVGAFIRQTLVQLATHDDMRGRVSSVNMVFASARNELGDMQSGFAASLVGPVAAVVLGGVCTLLVVGLWAWRFPGLRRVDRFPGLETRP